MAFRPVQVCVYLICVFVVLRIGNQISVSKCGNRTVSSDTAGDKDGLTQCLYRGTEKKTSLIVVKSTTCDTRADHEKLIQFLKNKTLLIKFLAVGFLILSVCIFLVEINIIPEAQKWYDTLRRPAFNGQHEVPIAALNDHTRHVTIIWMRTFIEFVSYLATTLLWKILQNMDEASCKFLVSFSCLKEHLEQQTDADIFCYIDLQNAVKDHFEFVIALCVLLSLSSAFYLANIYINYVMYLKTREDGLRPPFTGVTVLLDDRQVAEGSIIPTFSEYLLIKHIEATDNYRLENYTKENIVTTRIKHFFNTD